MAVMLLVPVVPLLMRDFGDLPGARYLIPSVLTVPALCVALLAAPMGYAGDWFGHRKLLIAALTGFAIVGAAPFVLSDFSSIFASRITLGVCQAAVTTFSATLIADYFEGRDREKWFGISATIASLSAPLFALVGGLLGEMLGWRGPMLVYLVAGLFVPAMVLLTRDGAQSKDLASPRADGRPFPAAKMVAVGVTTLAGSIFFHSLTVHQGLALPALGIHRPASVGTITALLSLGAPIGGLIFIRAARHGTLALLATEFLVFAASLLAISVAPSYHYFAVAASVGLVAAGMLPPTLLIWVLRDLPSAYRGVGSGLFQSLFSLGQFASGLIVPALAVRQGMLAAFRDLGIAALMAAGIIVALAAWTSAGASMANKRKH